MLQQSVRVKLFEIHMKHSIIIEKLKIYQGYFLLVEMLI